MGEINSGSGVIVGVIADRSSSFKGSDSDVMVLVVDSEG
jgi:hypothetical protein